MSCDINRQRHHRQLLHLASVDSVKWYLNKHNLLIQDFKKCLTLYREEKSLRHVAMVAKFLDGNKLKTSLIKCSRSFKLHWSYSISFQMLAKFSRVEFKRTVSKFRRGKRQLLCCVHLLQKASL